MPVPGLRLLWALFQGKLQNKEEAVKELALLLDMREETILQKLSASWVKEDSFVPLATIPKVSELELMARKSRSGASSGAAASGTASCRPGSYADRSGDPDVSSG